MAYTSTEHPFIWNLSHRPALWVAIVVAIGVLIAWLAVYTGVPVAELAGLADVNFAA